MPHGQFPGCARTLPKAPQGPCRSVDRIDCARPAFTGCSAMRLSIPPLLPPYGLLVLVLAYAFGSLWLGLARLDDIARMAVSTTKSGATLDDLQALREAVNDIEAAGPASVRARSTRLRQVSSGVASRVPALLAALRDKMRDDATELALLEELVPMIAERTTLAASSIERTRSATDPVKRRPDRSVGQGEFPSAYSRSSHRSGRASWRSSIRAARREGSSHRRGAPGPVHDGGRDDAARRCALPCAAAPEVVHRGDPEPAGTRWRSRRQRTLATAKDAGVGTLLRDALLRLQFVATDARADWTRTGTALPSGGRRARAGGARRCLRRRSAAARTEEPRGSDGNPCAGVFARRWPGDRGAARSAGKDAGSADRVSHFPIGGMGARSDRAAETRRRCHPGALPLPKIASSSAFTP